MDKSTKQNVQTEKEKAEKIQPNKTTKDSAIEEENFKEKFLRLNADFQNYKRRVDKERLEWMTESQIIILDKILPIFDELDRAIDLCHTNATKEKKEWLKGLQLIQKNWKKLFKDLNIKEINGDEKFDPELHDALMQVDSKEKKTGSIVQLLSKGYMYKDKVIRHAKVSVAK